MDAKLALHDDRIETWLRMVNAIPGVMYIESTASGKIAQVLKSLRLIRLIRIIKLYKYFLKSKALKEKKQIAQAEAKKRKV